MKSELSRSTPPLQAGWVGGSRCPPHCPALIAGPVFPREALGVVLHKDSKWYQQWKDFRDNNVVFNRECSHLRGSADSAAVTADTYRVAPWVGHKPDPPSHFTEEETGVRGDQPLPQDHPASEQQSPGRAQANGGQPCSHGQPGPSRAGGPGTLPWGPSHLPLSLPELLPAAGRPGAPASLGARLRIPP